MGERTEQALKLQFDKRLRLEFHGARITPRQMTCDLRRLRLKGIIWRVPKTYRYLVTPYGNRVALLFTKLNARVFRTTFASLDLSEPLPRPLAEAFEEVDRPIDAIIDHAQLGIAA